MKRREIQRVHDALGCISRLSVPHDFTIIAFGSSFSALLDADGYRFLFKASSLKGLWRLIPIPRSSCFIARIEDTRHIERFFDSISDFCSVAFMIFPIRFERAVIDDLMERENVFSSPILREPEHLVYFVDTDSSEFDTGIAEAISVGKDIDFKDGIIFV